MILWVREGNGRMSTMKKAGGTTGDWGMNWKEPQKQPKKEYLENKCNEIIEFQRKGSYDLMYMKTKELGWNETHGIQSIGIEDSQENRIVDQRQVLKIWENYITELYDRPNRPETL